MDAPRSTSTYGYNTPISIMSNSQSAVEYTPEERNRIIKDIARWKCELEIDQEFDHDDLTAFISSLRDHSDIELKSHWQDTVGEWVASRTDLDIPPAQDFTSWLTNQFHRLVNGQQTDYGFIIDVTLPPVANC